MNETQLTIAETPGPLTPVSESAQLLSVIAAAAQNPQCDVEKMRALLKFKQEIDSDEARKAYWRAMAEMSAEMPRVKKDGTIELKTREGIDKGKIPFATWEQMDSVLRPILKKHGFSLSFPTRVDGSTLIMACIVSHVGGHSERSEAIVRPDPGPGRNETQAGGSGRSYAKRYLTKDMLNIVTEGQDDDGKGSGFISHDQANQVHDLMMALELDLPANAKMRQAFLKFAGVEVVEHIQKYDLERVLTALKSKVREKEQGK